MSTMRTSPSPPSPAPPASSNSPSNAAKTSSRASMGPQSRTTGNSSSNLALPSPRPGGQSGGGRPTSELLGSGNNAALFQTPEAEAIDQWFENLQNYEVTLEEMAAASLDINFKEELGAIENWFRVLSEAERTAALYSLLQLSTQVQIRFFITVLQQMARSDPMTALLSPAGGGSMQSQMEAKLATLGLKSPALGGSFPTPASPSARNFGRQSIGPGVPPESASFLSPDTANAAGKDNEAAATLAQQRAKLHKANAAHRISAPGTLSNANIWSASAGANQLGQVAEATGNESGTASPAPDNVNAAARPKSTDLSNLGNLRSPRPTTEGGQDVFLSPAMGSWASQVNTPQVPLFDQDAARNKSALNAATLKLQNLNNNTGFDNKVVLEDASKFRRQSKGAMPGKERQEDGNLLAPNANRGGNRTNGGAGGFNGMAGWGGVRSPAMSSTRFSDDGSGGMNPGAMNNMNFGLGSPGAMMANMNMMGMPGFNNMAMMNHMASMNALAAAGLSPDPAQAQQMFAAQMAALSGQPGMNFMAGAGYRSPNRSRTGGGGGSARGSTTRGGGGDKPDEEIDPTLLEDVPAWLRSLRLHKYTPNFEGMVWRDMVVLSEDELEAKGVAALGARRKMLKTFEAVRSKMGVDAPNPPAVP